MPDFAYAGELALGAVLADPSGELAALQQQVATYPPALGEALVAGLWEAGFCLENARKALSRGDTAYIGGCLFRAVELCAYALHGRCVAPSRLGCWRPCSWRPQCRSASGATRRTVASRAVTPLATRRKAAVSCAGRTTASSLPSALGVSLGRR